jgi:putative tricarboxylic transport membrane protein
VSDRIAGVLLAAFSVWYGLAARQFEMGFTDPLGPTAFPQMLAVPLGVLGLYLIVKPDPDPRWVRGGPLLRQAAGVAILVAYALLLEDVGFPVATALAVALLARMLDARWWQALATGVGTSAVLFLLFDGVLGLPLPLGAPFGD